MATSRFQFDERNVFGGEASVTNPLCIDLCFQHGESILCQPCAHAMEPEVATALTQDGLVILMNLQFAKHTITIYYHILSYMNFKVRKKTADSIDTREKI